jgi:hypothetical protein
MAEWFAELFDERYLEFYAGLLDLSVAEEDARFVDRALALASEARSGAGSIPSSAKMSATVVRPISIFNPVRSASRIFV